jgi:hypothetical protein
MAGTVHCGVGDPRQHGVTRQQQPCSSNVTAALQLHQSALPRSAFGGVAVGCCSPTQQPGPACNHSGNTCRVGQQEHVCAAAAVLQMLCETRRLMHSPPCT